MITAAAAIVITVITIGMSGLLRIICTIDFMSGR